MADAAVAVARDEAGADERAPAHGGSSGITGAGQGPRVCFRGQADAVEPAQHQARTGADACWIGLCGAERRDFSQCIDQLDLREGAPREEAAREAQHGPEQPRFAALCAELVLLAASEREVGGDVQKQVHGQSRLDVYG